MMAGAAPAVPPRGVVRTTCDGSNATVLQIVVHRVHCPVEIDACSGMQRIYRQAGQCGVADEGTRNAALVTSI